MIGRSPRPRLHPGRHRKLPAVTETPMTPNVAASLPLHLAGPENALPVVPAEPERDVTCGNCGAIGPSSLIPEVPTRGPRCADVNACTKRWYAGKPVSLVPHGAEALEPLPEPETPVLPPVQEAALERFESAHDAQDAAEAGEDLSEDGPWLSHECLRGDCGDCPDPVECACGHHERDAAKAADALADHLGPDEQGFGEDEPAPVAAEPEPQPESEAGE